MRRTLFSILLFFTLAPYVHSQESAPAFPLLRAFVSDTLFRSSHLGVAVYDVGLGKYLHDYQSAKYFVPASNVKIFTCYAAMRYLDSLPGIRYFENDTAIYLLPAGDPSLLHRDFRRQPVIDFLHTQHKKLFVVDFKSNDEEIGKGWSWDDYNDEYMTERSPLPVYGNTIKWIQVRPRGNGPDGPALEIFSEPAAKWEVQFSEEPGPGKFMVRRDRTENIFTINFGPERRKELYVPFAVKGISTALELLKDTVGIPVYPVKEFTVTDPAPRVIRSYPVDSILRPMMYRSDNFFAEQLLLAAAGERFGILRGETMIDSLLAYDLKGLPQEPVWVDGCGLSRYNLFTPAAIVAVLDSMRKEFGMDRLKRIFPTGDSGTLASYFRNDTDKIYAKTGSMSGVLALSGYLYTRSGRLLIFSVLINNYTGSSREARRRVERFVHALR